MWLLSGLVVRLLRMVGLGLLVTKAPHLRLTPHNVSRPILGASLETPQLERTGGLF